MRLFLSGGAADGNPGYHGFLEAVDRTKPILYICFAVAPRNRVARYADFAARMAREGVLSTRLCDSAAWLGAADLSAFGGIFCSGGNTYRLLKSLREHGGIENIKAYLAAGGNGFVNWWPMSAFRHSGRANYSMIDGHVMSMSMHSGIVKEGGITSDECDRKWWGKRAGFEYD